MLCRQICLKCLKSLKSYAWEIAILLLSSSISQRNMLIFGTNSPINNIINNLTFSHGTNRKKRTMFSGDFFPFHLMRILFRNESILLLTIFVPWLTIERPTSSLGLFSIFSFIEKKNRYRWQIERNHSIVTKNMTMQKESTIITYSRYPATHINLIHFYF